jgi:hypothetical protein
MTLRVTAVVGLLGLLLCTSPVIADVPGAIAALQKALPGQVITSSIPPVCGSRACKP